MEKELRRSEVIRCGGVDHDHVTGHALNHRGRHFACIMEMVVDGLCQLGYSQYG